MNDTREKKKITLDKVEARTCEDSGVCHLFFSGKMRYISLRLLIPDRDLLSE